MSQEIYTLIMVAAAAIVLFALCWLARNDRDAQSYKRLIEAAGSRELAELAIAQARDMRLLNEALRLKEELRRQRSNVVRFVPRITSGGRPVRFTPDGAA